MKFPQSICRLGLLVALSASIAGAQQALIDPASPNLEKVKGSSAQVSFEKADTGLAVTIAPGEDGYPGVTITPAEGETWDLSKFGHLEAKITNTGDKPLTVTIRIDDNGPWQSNPWNAENLSIKPGETATGKVIFGHSWGYKKAHGLKSDAVTKVLLFTGKRKEPATFKVESLTAAGESGETPPVDPASVRIVPENGIMLGGDAKVDARQLKTSNAEAQLVDGAIKVDFAKGKAGQSVTFAPPAGRWDLRRSLQVRVAVRNEGKSEAQPRFRLTSNFGNGDVIAADAIKPGEKAEIVIPFQNESVWTGPKPEQMKGEHISGNGGTKFGSDAVSGVVVSMEKPANDATLVIESIKAEMPEPATLPEWVGKRPPVEGDWKMTFNDEFEGSEIDISKWNYYGANYWDKKSRFSKNNTYVKDGTARLKFEKSTGRHNDDPEGKETEYATGFLDTYGKWVQRYGYFESRMKLPDAPGVWPAFWTMPDRGLEAGPQWKRQATEKDGMEFDIMEHLSRWGPYRYTIAMHWDGYGKNHKATGAASVYFNPDKDGYVTAGVLWEPGKVVYYSQGKEVARWETDRIPSVPACIIYTLPTGGWDNNALDDKQLPVEFEIDYVRVWQRADLASEVDGPKTPEPGNELGKDRK
jgi:beta-glucanase (GH16 family)